VSSAPGSGGLVHVARVRRADAAELIAANHAARAYHAPWIEAFLDQVARERDGDGLVGVLTLSQIVMGNFRSAYLGYWGYPHCAGRGLMTQALRATVRFAFDELGLHRVEANIRPDNLRSIALVRRVGFRREGFSPRYLRIGDGWHDHERWALLADD
jgi:ribosomal-protein-alanine N-acetyltransferase